jgi:hypothetical protein
MALASVAAGVTLRIIFRSGGVRRGWLWSPAACRSPSV